MIGKRKKFENICFKVGFQATKIAIGETFQV
jgi:hypothetical protein